MKQKAKHLQTLQVSAEMAWNNAEVLENFVGQLSAYKEWFECQMELTQQQQKTYQLLSEQTQLLETFNQKLWKVAESLYAFRDNMCWEEPTPIKPKVADFILNTLTESDTSHRTGKTDHWISETYLPGGNKLAFYFSPMVDLKLRDIIAELDLKDVHTQGEALSCIEDHGKFLSIKGIKHSLERDGNNIPLGKELVEAFRFFEKELHKAEPTRAKLDSWLTQMHGRLTDGINHGFAKK